MVTFDILTNLILVVVPPINKSVVRSRSKIDFNKNKWSKREPLYAINLIFFLECYNANETRKSKNYAKQSAP